MYTMDKQPLESKGNKKNAAALCTALMAFSLILAPKAYGQGVTTLHDPYVPGASTQMPGVPAPLGTIPPIGSGATSLPPPVGMTGPPTLIPSIPAIPSNNINSSFSGVGLPAMLPGAFPPGTAGLILSPLIPNSPSTPGPARPMLQGFNNPALTTPIVPTGGYAGTGGFNTTIPKNRRGGNSTVQYERRSHLSFIGGGGNSQDEITQFGPLAGFGQINGIPTGTGYNKGSAYTNADNFNKSIDLGGGMRNKIGNVVLSTGKTVQDLNGRNVLYGNSTPTLGASLSTDFAQGARNAFSSVGRIPNRTTDFGFPLRQQTALNAHPYEPGRIAVPPTGVVTNF